MTTLNALDLFKAGNDYIAIAAFLNTSEAEVEKEIHRLRKIIWEKARKREQRRIYQKEWNQRNREMMREMRAGA